MSNEALFLILISTGLFACFFVAIVGAWLFGYYKEKFTAQTKRKLQEWVTLSFKLTEEQGRKKQAILNEIYSYTERNAYKKEMLIQIILDLGDAYIDENHGILTSFYDETGIKAFLIKRLSSKSDYITSLACRHIGELRVYSTEPQIVSLITSKNNDVIYNVLLALAKLGDSQGLIRILTNDSGNINISSRAVIEIISVFRGSKEELLKATIEYSDNYIKGILIKAAADYRIEGLRDAYIKYLKSDNKNLRIACIRALSELSESDNEHYIIESLQEDLDWEIRAVAAKSLEKLGTSNSFQALGRSTGDREWWVRQNAATTLISIPGGIEYAQSIIDGDDNYARDAVIGVLERR